MGIPSFNAAASLAETRGWYGGTGQRIRKGAVTPAQAACTAGGWCGTVSTGPLCPCPPGRTCTRRCSNRRDCRVNWFTCAFFPPIGCIPQCEVTRLCTIDLFCD